MATRHTQEGVTLVELVISIVIIAIAVSAVLGVFTLNAKRSADAMVSEQAVAIASAYLEEISLKPFRNATTTGNTRATFDDIEDYDGLDDTDATDQFGNAIAGLQSFGARASVTSGSLGSLPAADVLRIDVTVQHDSGYTLRLTGYRTRY